MDMKSKHKTREALFCILIIIYYIWFNIYVFIIFSEIYYPIWVSINDYRL